MSLDYSYRFWFYLGQDVDRPIGGVKQIHLFSECLTSLGFESFVIHSLSSYRPSWFHSKANIVGIEDAKVSISDPSKDIIVYPETFISVVDSSWKGFSKILLNQNSHFTFGLKRNYDPHSVLRLYRRCFSHFLCVSKHDEIFLVEGLDIPSRNVSRIVNGIDTTIFYMPAAKRRQVAFMPRKNTSDSKIVCSLLSSKPWFKGWSFVAIDGMSQDKVASVLRESLLFLSFGHPEGFGLPLVEATSCGCALIGYTGNGGAEVFNDFHSSMTSSIVSFNDWSGFIQSVRKFVINFDKDPHILYSALLQSSTASRQAFSYKSMETSILYALEALTSSIVDKSIIHN